MADTRQTNRAFTALLAVMVALGLSLAAPADSTVYDDRTANQASMDALPEESEQELAEQLVIIDDGIVPLHNIPPNQGIPPVLMLMTGGLLFAGAGIVMYMNKHHSKWKK